MCRSAQKSAVQQVKTSSGKESDFCNIKDSKQTSSALVDNVGNDNVKADPMYLNVTIDGKNCNMEIDSGTYVAIISNKDKNKYFPNYKVTSAEPLNAYGKIPLKSKEIMENLNVKIGDRKVTLKMRVMTRNGPMLIGRQWLKVFGL